MLHPKGIKAHRLKHFFNGAAQVLILVSAVLVGGRFGQPDSVRHRLDPVSSNDYVRFTEARE